MAENIEPNLDFKSKEQFRVTLQQLSARLGYLNRVAIGESNLVIAVSDMLSRLGKAFDEHLESPETNAAFGGPYTHGTVSREQRTRALFELMYPSEKSS